MANLGVQGYGNGFYSKQFAGAVLSAALLGPLIAPREASAQPKAAASASSDDVARIFAVGVRAAESGDWEKARQLFEAAWAGMRHAKIAMHLGRAELKTGRYPEAIEHLSYFLRVGKDFPESVRKEVTEMLTQALAKVAKVTVRANIEGAELFVDGRSVGRAPLAEPVYVEPGRRTFEARVKGYAPKSVMESIKAGTAPEVELSLAKEGADVSGPPQSSTPVVRLDRAPESRADDREVIRERVVFSGLGLSAALAIASVVLDGASEATYRERLRAQKKDAPTAEIEGLEGKRRTFAIAVAGTAIGSAVFAAATGACFYVLRPDRPTSGSKVGLRLIVNGREAALVGQW
jgi:hypothetical protein